MLSTCSDGTVDSSNNNSDLAQLEAQFSSVGKVHNAGLKRIYNSIKNNGEINSREDLFNTIDKSGRNFLRNHYDSDILQSEAINSFSEGFKSIRGLNPTTLNKKFTTFDSTTNESTPEQLNTEQKKLLKKVINVLTKNDELPVIQNKLDDINEEAANKLNSKKELTPIVVATTVAEASFEYWQKNMDDWQDIIREAGLKNNTTAKANNNIPSASSDNGYDPGQTAAVDAGSALAGAGWSAVTGCAQLTAGGCAAAGFVGAGVVGSAADAAGQAYDYFFGEEKS
jgi:hypothetical protein